MNAALRVRLAGLALVAAVLTAGCSQEAASTQKAVEESLTCQCGCGLTVHTCNHLQCSFGVPVKEDVAASLAAGQTADEILDRYVAEYGEKILSSPIPEGFNLVAWFGPYVALLSGALLLIFALRRWREPAGESGSPLAEENEHTDEERRRLERELEDLDR